MQVFVGQFRTTLLLHLAVLVLFSVGCLLVRIKSLSHLIAPSYLTILDTMVVPTVRRVGGSSLPVVERAIWQRLRYVNGV